MGIQVCEFLLFKDLYWVFVDEILFSIVVQICLQIWVLGMIWVQLGSGVKLLICEIGKLVCEFNQKCDEQDWIIYVVDGVYGFGVEDVSFVDFDCDYFIVGIYKWLFGLCGIGVIIVCLEQFQEYLVLSILIFFCVDNFGILMIFGGYYVFEYCLVLGMVFELYLQLGKVEVQVCIYQFNVYFKQCLGEYFKVCLVMLISFELFLGFIFFCVEGCDCEVVVKYLMVYWVISDVVDCDVGLVVCLVLSLLNDEVEIDWVLEIFVL